MEDEDKGNCSEHVSEDVSDYDKRLDEKKRLIHQDFVDGELDKLYKKYPDEVHQWMLIPGGPQGKLVFISCFDCGTPKFMTDPLGHPLCITCVLKRITDGTYKVELR